MDETVEEETDKEEAECVHVEDVEISDDNQIVRNKQNILGLSEAEDTNNEDMASTDDSEQPQKTENETENDADGVVTEIMEIHVQEAPIMDLDEANEQEQVLMTNLDNVTTKGQVVLVDMPKPKQAVLLKMDHAPKQAAVVVAMKPNAGVEHKEKALYRIKEEAGSNDDMAEIHEWLDEGQSSGKIQIKKDEHEEQKLITSKGFNFKKPKGNRVESMKMSERLAAKSKFQRIGTIYNYSIVYFLST